MQYNKEIKKEALYKQCICECGGAYMNHRKLRHERTNKHQMFITNQVKETKQEYRKRYYEENKEKVNEQNKIWNEANKERMKQYHKEYEEANKEALSEKRKAKFTCECGVTCSIGGKSIHYRTGRHCAIMRYGIDYVEMDDMHSIMWNMCWKIEYNLSHWKELMNEYELNNQLNETHFYPYINTIKQYTF